MDFTLSEEQKIVRETFRNFVEKEIKPTASILDEKEEYPLEEFRKVGELGYFGLRYPEKYGGSDASILTYTIATEELARGSLAVATACAMQSLMGIYFIYRSGKKDLINEYLVPAIKGEKIGGICMTEAHAGSDLPALRTYSRKEGDGYVLNGEKMWITSAPVADFFTVFTKKDDPENKEMNVFLVEKTTPGFNLGKNIKKMGLKASLTSEIFLDNCRVPARNLLGEEGKGMDYLREILVEIRVMTGALSIGVAQAAFEAALEYSRQREAFGRPIGKFQAIQMKLADMTVKLETSRSLVYKAAWRSDQNLPNMKHASMAKLYASESAVSICDEACRIFGGYGYAKEYPVERYFRDARFTLIGGGTSEILKSIIARELNKE